MQKVQYDNQPLKFEAVGDGSFKYRWNIQQVVKTEEDGTETTLWECDEVVVWKNDKREVKKEVIKYVANIEVEAKLINDFNAANEGLMNEDYKQPYIDFITQRNALKQEIDDYFNSL